MGVQGASRVVKTWRLWESCSLGEGMKALHPFPHTLCHASLHLPINSYPLISFVTNQ